MALLRAVNLGARPVNPQGLVRWLEGCGLSEVRSWSRTGSLVFQAQGHTPLELEGELERSTQEALGLDTDCMVRTQGEWDSLVRANPFPEFASADPSHLVAYLLKGQPPGGALERLQATQRGPEEHRLVRRHLYATYPEGIGRSKLRLVRIERALGTRGTGRNWNTALKFQQLARERSNPRLRARSPQGSAGKARRSFQLGGRSPLLLPTIT